ncbi:Protein T10B10.4 a [Aphelenchoides avenae]|nr:Protein T10B10.4 a [Aphelenchus avenae]
MGCIVFIGWVKQRACGKDFHFTPTHLFYMTQQQMDTVSASKQQLPDGYSVVKMDAVRDVQFVTDCWKFKLPNEAIRTRETLLAIPSYAAKDNASGELSAFELIDVSSGCMYHLFTMEEHRKKGLANAVELANCRLCIALNIIPYKFVETVHPIALESSMRNPLFTTWKVSTDDEEAPVNIMFVRYEVR